MKYRPSRTIPAVVVATLLLAACVLVAVSAVQLLIGHIPLIPVDRLAAAGHRLNWHDVVVIVAGAVPAALGLVAVGRRRAARSTDLPASQGPSGRRRASGRRRDPAKPAQDTVAQRRIDRRRSLCAVRLRRRAITVKVRSHRSDLAGIDSRVRETVSQRLDSIELAERPALRVRVTQVGKRRWAV